MDFDLKMQPLFIILDLDDTLVDGRSRELLGGVHDCLQRLKSAGHYLSVCSNNVLAKEILAEHNLLEIFDCVIGRSSTSHKSFEVLECISHYRQLYRSKAIRWKIHLNRVAFIDNDEENLKEIKQRFESIQTYLSVAQLIGGLRGRCKPPAVKLSDVYQRVIGEYGVPMQIIRNCCVGDNITVYRYMHAVASREINQES